MWYQRLLRGFSALILISALLPGMNRAQTASANFSQFSRHNLEVEPTCQFTFIHTTFTWGGQISGNGRYVVYSALAPFPGQMDSLQEFVYDKVSRTNQQVSLSWEGKSMFYSYDYHADPTISANGIYVVFYSSATGLVPDPTVNGYQLYLRDRVKSTTQIVSVGVNGVGNGEPKWPTLSTDGRYLVFQSMANNMVPGDTNQSLDVFIRDLKLKVTEIISVASDGSQGTDSSEYGYPNVDVSADGRFVVFPYESLKGDDGVVRSGLFLRDRQFSKTYWIGPGSRPSMTPDGHYITFVSREALIPTDTNGTVDVYLYDRLTRAYELVSLTSTDRLSQGAQNMSRPTITSDGNQIAFTSDSSDLVPFDRNNTTDAFVRDRRSHTTVRLTVDSNGVEANGPTNGVSISANGSALALVSRADNLGASVPPSIPEYFLYLCERRPAAVEQGIKVFIPLIIR